MRKILWPHKLKMECVKTFVFTLSCSTQTIFCPLVWVKHVHLWFLYNLKTFLVYISIWYWSKRVISIHIYIQPHTRACIDVTKIQQIKFLRNLISDIAQAIVSLKTAIYKICSYSSSEVIFYMEIGSYIYA